MRDDNDYHRMTREDLREHFVRVSKELATWEFALGMARKDLSQAWTEGYTLSTAKSTTERKADAEVHAGPYQREVYEDEGHVRFFATIRDLVAELLRAPSFDDLVLD